MGKIITIHHEYPCRIEISHPRARNFNQGQGLPRPWLNSHPEGDISLSYMDRLMMDLFFSHFSKVFCRNREVQKREKLNFLLVRFALFLSARVFLLGH